MVLTFYFPVDVLNNILNLNFHKTTGIYTVWVQRSDTSLLFDFLDFCDHRCSAKNKV